MHAAFMGTVSGVKGLLHPVEITLADISQRYCRTRNSQADNTPPNPPRTLDHQSKGVPTSSRGALLGMGESRASAIKCPRLRAPGYQRTATVLSDHEREIERHRT